MKYGSVEGPVTSAGFEKWFELESFDWGFTNPYDRATLQATATSQVHEVVVTKRSDRGSPMLVQAGLDHNAASVVKFKFTTTTKDKVDTFMSYELANCMISKYQVSSGREGSPQETLTLNFTKITFEFTSRDAKITGAPSSYTYDLIKGGS